MLSISLVDRVRETANREDQELSNLEEREGAVGGTARELDGTDGRLKQGKSSRGGAKGGMDASIFWGIRDAPGERRWELDGWR